MNEQQEIIKSNARWTFSALSSFSDAVTSYQQEARKIDAEEYLTNEGREKKKNDAFLILKQKAQEVHDEIAGFLSAIRTAALKMEGTFSISPELQAAITLVNATGKNLDPETRDRLWKQFIGDNSALRALKALFESKEMYSKELEKYIIRADEWCDSLDDLAAAFVIQPGSNLSQTVALGRKLEKFCELEGVELDKPFVEYLGADNYSQFYTDQLREALGI